MPLRRFIPHVILVAVVLCSFAVSAAAAVATPLPDGANDFNSPGFVVRHAWLKFGFLATEPFRGHLTAAEEDTKVARFFALNGQINDEERIVGDPASDAGSRALALDDRHDLVLVFSDQHVEQADHALAQVR